MALSARVIDAAVADAARDVLDRYFAALIARDPDAVRAVLHFPHIRIALDGAVSLFPDESSDFLADFVGRMGADGWAYSVIDAFEPIETFADKAHVWIGFRRFRADDSLIGAYRTLYVITRVAGRWGIQSGSGGPA